MSNKIVRDRQTRNSATHAKRLAKRANKLDAELAEVKSQIVLLAPMYIQMLLDNGLKVGQIAEQMGMSPTYVSKVRKKKVVISIAAFSKLVEVL